MSSLLPRSLRTRLMLAAVIGSVLLLGALVAGFNLVLDARLGADADNLLRDRAAAQLRTLSTVDGRLHVLEAPDNATPDTLTWIFAGPVALEQPSGGVSARAVRALAPRAPALATDAATDTRLLAVPIVAASRRLGTLVVGASLLPYDNSAHTALVASLILGGVIVVAIALASGWIIRRALAPVAKMTADAADWGEHDLSRRFYAGPAHDELSTLAATFDQLLARLAQSLAREQRFTAEISHELRTPLAKIVAETELALGRERTSNAYQQVLSSIGAAAEQLGGALDALLTAARAESAGVTSTIDVRALAERVARSHRDAAAALGVAIQVTGASVWLHIGSAPDLIERTLAPILENAIRHAEEGVEIALSHADGELRFEISDDGPGVEPSDRERIFEPGVSGGTASNGQASGAGLGLPLARRLAQAAGGQIECVTASTGTAFRVRFPIQ